MFEKITEELKELIRSIIVAFLIAFLVNTVIGVTTVQGASMEPTLHTGNKLIINKVNKLIHNIDRGDVIVFDSTPGESRKNKVFYIKRVIGLPGDKVEILKGNVFVNGEEIDESYADKTNSYTNLSITVPEDSYFVLGDNRDKSNDSRYFGTILHSQVTGNILMQIFPSIRFKLN